MKQNKLAFTLIELIVVVVIIAILWTIAYMSLLNYSKSSRNSVRITDIWQIKQSLWIFEVETWKYPLPLTYTWVTYSWWLLWYQWRYDNQVFSILDNLSKKSIDPLFEIEYDYSVINNKTKFQIWTILEWTYLSLWSQSLPLANAIAENDASSYVFWDYDLFDISSKVWSNCTLITIPSLFVNNLSSTWALTVLGNHWFIYDWWKNYTQSYMTKIDNLTTSTLFPLKEVWKKCSIDTLDELNLYISKLAIAFQQLNWNNDFNEIIFNFNKNSFKQWMLDKIANNWIKVNPDLIRQLQNPTEWNIFNDFFTASNGINLLSHTPDTFWSWTRTWALVDWSYIISWNELTKTDTNIWVISPEPVLPITSRDKTIILTIKDFSWGSITAYTKYIDANNRMWIELTPTWYSIINIESWASLAWYPNNSVETILLDSLIEFSIDWNNIWLIIDNVDKWTIVDSVNDLSWFPALDISASGWWIDDFTLIYR